MRPGERDRVGWQMQGSPRPEGGVVSAFAAVEVTDEDDDPATT
jgi:hypothetical protein